MDISEGAGRFRTHVLSYAPPGANSRAIGVCVLDVSTDGLYLQLPESWEFVEDDGDREYFEMLGASFRQIAEEWGGTHFLTYLLDTLSHTLRISDAHIIAADDPAAAVQQAYERFVHLD